MFKLLTQFSLMTMKALESANKIQITSAIRCEIISCLASEASPVFSHVN